MSILLKYWNIGYESQDLTIFATQGPEILDPFDPVFGVLRYLSAVKTPPKVAQWSIRASFG